MTTKNTPTTQEFGTGHRLRWWPVKGKRRIAGPLAMTVAGMAALPAGIAADLMWSAWSAS